jgi:hypothetical protein
LSRVFLLVESACMLTRVRHTEAAVAWRAWGDDVTIKNFVRQYAFDILKRQWADGELEIEYLRVDAVCALVEAMVILLLSMKGIRSLTMSTRPRNPSQPRKQGLTFSTARSCVGPWKSMQHPMLDLLCLPSPEEWA